MSKLPTAEKEEADDLRSRSMSQVMEALQPGGTVFAKKLRPTHVPRQNHSCNGLSLPPWFVEKNMARICRAVVLLTKKPWPLRLALVRWERVIPEVVFSGGWKTFAASNNLAEGDQLVFNLSAPSQFHVYIFNADGTPKPKLAPISRFSECKQDHMDHVEEKKPSVNGYFAREEIIQEILGEDLEERKPSANGSCGYSVKESLELAEEDRERNIDKYSSNNLDRRASRDHQHEAHHPPSFFKRLTLTNFKDNCLEIPAMFNKTYGNRLQSPIKLQGVFEASAVYTLTCRWEQTPRSRPSQSRRLFLASGWKEFRNENMLELQQELEFTLVSNSYFVVRVCPRFLRSL